MEFRPFSVSSFFGQSKIKYTIPSYQRAYSWDEPQWTQFFDDLYEHRHSTEQTPYCYGNVLLQVIKQNAEYGIIDGQQRITTLSIFVRSLLNTIKERNLESEDLIVEDEERIFFKDFNIIKLHPVQYDDGCYQAIIIENNKTFNTETPSQRRMLSAKEWFLRKLQNITNEDLLAMFNTLKIARLNVIELSGSKESALMFELQNNRGKKLTNLESLKSFFMYQIYVYSSPDSVDTNIDYISNLFAPIYKISNDLNELLVEGDYENEKYALSEDNVLLYHSYAYSKRSFGYRNLDDTISEFKEISDQNKVQWIKDFVLELHTSFTNIKRLLTYDDNNLACLRRLGMPTFTYPFIIKGMKYDANDKEKMSAILKVLEVLSFRYKLVNSRADIRSRLSEVIRSFDGNPEQLASSMNQKMNEAQYWGDEKTKEVLNGYMFHNSVLHYLLWEYEGSLYQDGYRIGAIQIEDESIEHISPQTENDEGIASGYEVQENGLYSEEFRNQYLNKLGNLMLISRSQNSTVGNRPFSEKLASYTTHPILRQQGEIVKFVSDEETPKWLASSIDNRHSAILEYAINRWKFV